MVIITVITVQPRKEKKIYQVNHHRHAYRMAGRKSAIPPLLEPYLRLPPESSLLLLTGVLNATPHWLIPRILRGAYGDSSGSRTATTAAARNRSTAQEEEGEDREEQKDEENGNGNVAVVLVSWLRDFEFWKQEARRGAVRAVLSTAPLPHVKKDRHGQTLIEAAQI